MDPEFFIHVPLVNSKEDALAIMCHQLVAAGVVHDNFYDDVLDREQRSSTAFGGPFAIPHSMFMDARRTAIAVLVTDRAVPWGSSSVRLVVLFALSPDGRQIFRDVLDKLIGLLAEPLTT
ncbi:MAG: PTS sugar transporter subunit IIA, partial [Propionicimonas sp.]